MNNYKKALIESDLIKAIMAFHDCDDKERRESYVREYFLDFCDNYDINKEEALKLLEDFFESKRKNTMFKYEYYKDLKSIIFPENNEKNKNLEDDDERI